MTEKWKMYNETAFPEGQYEIIEVRQNADGTNILLESETYNITIKFGFVDAFRVCDEGRRIKTYNEIEGLQIYREDFVGIPLFTVDNSKFCEWVTEESAGFCIDCQHYAVVTMNDIVDVLSSLPPEISLTSK